MLPLLMFGALLGSDVSVSATEVVATEMNNGKTIAVGKGDSLVISLESNPSTGYVWQVGKNDNAILKPVGQPAFHPSTDRMLGASGRQLFKVEAISAGRDALELGYVRPWEQGVAPAKTFGIIATVK
jgi:inhibitor of cysteine peptidase